MQLTTDLTADSYQQQAGRTLISDDTVPTFPLDGLATLVAVLRLSVQLGELLDNLKKSVLHEHHTLTTDAALAELYRIGTEMRRVSRICNIGDGDSDIAALQANGHNLRLLWNSVGLSGEAAEVGRVVQAAIDGATLIVPALTKELGDVAWYTAALCSVAGLDFNAVLHANLDKLAVRYPAGWSAAASKARPAAPPTADHPATGPRRPRIL